MTDNATRLAALFREAMLAERGRRSRQGQTWADRLAARLDAAGVTFECEHCVPAHEWPCPTIPRCWVEGCGKEATCGYPCAEHRYHRSCGTHYEMEEKP